MSDNVTCVSVPNRRRIPRWGSTRRPRRLILLGIFTDFMGPLTKTKRGSEVILVVTEFLQVRTIFLCM